MTHQKLSAHARLKQIIQMALLADEVGLDIFYRRAGESAGHEPAVLKVAVTSYLHVARTSQEALETFYPYRTNYFQSLGGERVKHMSFSRSDYEREARKENALFVGSPQQITDKLLYQYELFGHQRFIGQVDIGGMPFDKVAQTIELLGTEVAPVVRRATAKASPDERN